MKHSRILGGHYFEKYQGYDLKDKYHQKRRTMENIYNSFFAKTANDF